MAGATMLPLLSVVMFLCSVNNLLAIYQIALRRYLAVVPVVAGVVVLVVGLALFHANFTEFIAVLLAANATVFVLLSIEILVEKKAIFFMAKEMLSVMLPSYNEEKESSVGLCGTKEAY